MFPCKRYSFQMLCQLVWSTFAIVSSAELSGANGEAAGEALARFIQRRPDDEVANVAAG